MSREGPAHSKVFQNALRQATANVPPCTAAFQGVPTGSNLTESHHKWKTNPKRSLGALTTRQLTAARLLMQGLRTEHVASQLSTTRQTINRWRRLPQFDVELKRLHDLMAVKPLAHSRPNAPERAGISPGARRLCTEEYVENFMKRYGGILES